MQQLKTALNLFLDTIFEDSRAIPLAASYQGNGAVAELTEKNVPERRALGQDSGVDFFTPFRKADAKEICMAPYEYTVNLPGKKTIARFIDAAQVWFRLPPDSLEAIKKALAMLFNSTQMLDDIQDNSGLRRGKPAAEILYGQSQTINSSTYAIVSANVVLEQLKESSGRREFSDGLETLCFGQGLELYWKFHGICPSAEDYITMVDNKTGGFFRLALRLLETESSAQPNTKLGHLVTLSGRYYQIRDDYKNLVSEEYTATKGFCDDLSEGKFSLPLIHLLQTSPSNRVRGILCHRDIKGGMSPELKSYILAEMQSTGSLRYTSTIIDEMERRILETLDQVEAEMGTNKDMRILILGLIQL